MKYGLFILLVVITYVHALPSENITEEFFAKMEVECQKELNTTDKKWTTTEEIKHFEACLMTCLGKKLGFINKEDLFNIDRTLNFIQFVQKANNDTKIDLPITKTAVEYCNKNREVVKDECISTRKLFECLSDKMKESGLTLF